MKTELCRRCWEFLPVEQFHKSNKTQSGFQLYCKKCRKKEYNKTYALKQRNKKKKLMLEENDGVDVTYIKFSNIDFNRDHSNMLKMLSIIGYDPNKDIHEQFLKRVLMKSGEILSKGEQPDDVISKYYK